jgi:hypothetical protein
MLRGMTKKRKSFRQTRDYARVLAYVNRFRTKRGAKPIKALPKGKPRIGTSCPIANALKPVCGGSIFVAGDEIRIYDVATRQNVYFTPPQYVGRFVRRFDDDMIPELVER